MECNPRCKFSEISQNLDKLMSIWALNPATCNPLALPGVRAVGRGRSRC
jgi:hypothetical protein